MFLGKYEVLDTIGVGGFGRVLLARDPDQVDPSAQLVAIKRLRKARVQRKGSLEAITNEARLGSYLSHPNIVRVIELAQVDRDLLLVMEFINGLGLDELLSQRRLGRLALPPVVALEIASQAGRGLHYAHSARSPDGTPLHIVHRDIKPSNIMICRQGIVRVMDFGVARHALPRIQTTTGTIKGTLRYLSPEQAQGVREIGPETDQFALGLVLGEMLIGRPVYDAEHDHQILLKALRCQVSTALEQAESILPGSGLILSRALAMAPGDRYPDVGELVRAIETLKQTLPAGPALAELVHRGLEERARLAAEEQRELLTSAPDAQDAASSADSSAESGQAEASSDVYSVSWADHLRGTDATGESEAAGWEAGEELEEPAPVLVANQADIEGWAMVPSSSEELEWEMLKRTPVTGEFPAGDLKAPSRRRTRKVMDLSAELAATHSSGPEPVGSGASRERAAATHRPSPAARSAVGETGRHAGQKGREDSRRLAGQPGSPSESLVYAPQALFTGEAAASSAAPPAGPGSVSPAGSSGPEELCTFEAVAARAGSPAPEPGGAFPVERRVPAAPVEPEYLWSQEDIPLLGSDNIRPLSGEWAASPGPQTAEPAASPTAYSVKRPGRDRIASRPRVPSAPQASPVVLEEPLSSAPMESGADDEAERWRTPRETAFSAPVGSSSALSPPLPPAAHLPVSSSDRPHAEPVRPSGPTRAPEPGRSRPDEVPPSTGRAPVLEPLPPRVVRPVPPPGETEEDRKGLKGLLRWLVRSRERP